MCNKTLYSLWGILFILCSALGFLTAPNDMVQAVMTCLSVAFFIPPALLLYHAGKAGDRHTLLLIRNLSLASLGLTLLVLVLNLTSAFRPEFWGAALHALLVIISAPMVCSGCWVLSLFLWACILMVSLQMLRKK